MEKKGAIKTLTNALLNIVIVFFSINRTYLLYCASGLLVVKQSLVGRAASAYEFLSK